MESVSDFKDFAEYFESADGKKIDSSYLVALEGEKIRKAEKGTRFSELFPKLRTGARRCCVLLERSVRKKRIRGTVYETVFHGGEEIRIPKLNPDYDPSLEYVPRDSRDEWHVI